jgi:hypothetical protein
VCEGMHTGPQWWLLHTAAGHMPVLVLGPGRWRLCNSKKSSTVPLASDALALACAEFEVGNAGAFRWWIVMR